MYICRRQMYDLAFTMTVKFFDKKEGTYFKKINDRVFSSNHKTVEIHNNIPRFVASESYASAFGEQWNRFRKLQLDSYTNTHFSRKRLEQALCDSPERVFSDKVVLEAGSGAGRFTEIIAPYSKELYTFDLSSAIDANFENNQAEHIRFFQADLLDMPFEDKVFDVVVCLGVLQHTPDTKRAIEELWRVVKHGGLLIADHYHFRWAYYTTVVPFYRFFLKRLNPKTSMEIVQKLVKIFFPLHWKYRHSPVGKWILGHLSPLLTNIDSFEEKGYEFNKDTSFLETYDALTDYYKRLITKKELIQILTNLNDLSTYSLKKGGNGWEFKLIKK